MTHEEKLLEIKEKLRAKARELHPDDEEAQNAYVFGTLRKIKEAMAK